MERTVLFCQTNFTPSLWNFILICNDLLMITNFAKISIELSRNQHKTNNKDNI